MQIGQFGRGRATGKRDLAWRGSLKHFTKGPAHPRRLRCPPHNRLWFWDVRRRIARTAQFVAVAGPNNIVIAVGGGFIEQTALAGQETKFRRRSAGAIWRALGKIGSRRPPFRERPFTWGAFRPISAWRGSVRTTLTTERFPERDPVFVQSAVLLGI